MPTASAPATVSSMEPKVIMFGVMPSAMHIRTGMLNIQ